MTITGYRRGIKLIRRYVCVNAGDQCHDHPEFKKKKYKKSNIYLLLFIRYDFQGLKKWNFKFSELAAQKSEVC